VTDRIVLSNIQVDGRHGVSDEERASPQPFGVDVEVAMDLQAAGRSDDLERTIDYRGIDAVVRRIVGGPSMRLLETLAEGIAERVLEETPADEVIVRVRKPQVRLGGPIDWSAVEIRRRRPGASESPRPG
jgi:dihydroneopterin aldolase